MNLKEQRTRLIGLDFTDYAFALKVHRRSQALVCLSHSCCRICFAVAV